MPSIIKIDAPYLPNITEGNNYFKDLIVFVGRIQNKKILQRYGVSHGRVLCPSLFLLFIIDLVSELPRVIIALR